MEKKIIFNCFLTSSQSWAGESAFISTRRRPCRLPVAFIWATEASYCSSVMRPEESIWKPRLSFRLLVLEKMIFPF